MIPGKASPLQSFVTVQSGTVESGTGTTVILQAVDAFGNLETTGGLAVKFGLATSGPGTGQGTFSKAIDNLNGTYTATFTGTVEGDNSIVASINGVPVTNPSAIVTVTPGQVSLAKSLVKVVQTTVTAGDSITVFLQAKDAAGNVVPADNLGVGFYLRSTLSGAQGTFSLVNTQSRGPAEYLLRDIHGYYCRNQQNCGFYRWPGPHFAGPRGQRGPWSGEFGCFAGVSTAEQCHDRRHDHSDTASEGRLLGNKLKSGGLNVLLILLEPIGWFGAVYQGSRQP